MKATQKRFATIDIAWRAFKATQNFFYSRRKGKKMKRNGLCAICDFYLKASQSANFLVNFYQLHDSPFYGWAMFCVHNATDLLVRFIRGANLIAKTASRSSAEARNTRAITLIEGERARHPDAKGKGRDNDAQGCNRSSPVVRLCHNSFRFLLVPRAYRKLISSVSCQNKEKSQERSPTTST